MGSAENLAQIDPQVGLPDVPERPSLSLVKTAPASVPHKTNELIFGPGILPFHKNQKKAPKEQVRRLAILYRKGDFPLSKFQAIRKAMTELNSSYSINISEIPPMFTPITEPEPIPVFSAQEQPTLEKPALERPTIEHKPIPRFTPNPAMG